MEEQKNIDTLFQQKLKDFEVAPNEKNWRTIEKKLYKKKRRIIPFWWFSSGVAAIFIVTFLLFPLDEGKGKIEVSPKNVVTKPFKEEEKIENEREILIVQRDKDVKIELKADDKTANSKQNKSKEIGITKRLQNDKKEDTILNNNRRKKNFKVDKFSKNIGVIAKNEHHKSDEINTKSSQEITEKKSDKIEQKKESILESVVKNSKEIIEENNENKWSVASIFGVIGANSFSKTSPLDSNLNGSTKGNNSISYGIQISYKINNKWSFQSGIHLQKIAYSNANIAVTASNIKSSSINFNSGDLFILNSTTRENFDANSLSLNTVSFNGNMHQNFSYLEIPLEVKYNLSKNSKFATQIVTGFSTLFLNGNEVLLSSTNLQKIGEATNLNDFNFSGNLGLDFNYVFDKNWSLQLNPMFKAQLNTYNKNSNGFQPYFIAVYTGINYRF
jgi:hypothetical protein